MGKNIRISPSGRFVEVSENVLPLAGRVSGANSVPVVATPAILAETIVEVQPGQQAVVGCRVAGAGATQAVRKQFRVSEWNDSTQAWGNETQLVESDSSEAIIYETVAAVIAGSARKRLRCRVYVSNTSGAAITPENTVDTATVYTGGVVAVGSVIVYEYPAGT